MCSDHFSLFDTFCDVPASVVDSCVDDDDDDDVVVVDDVVC